VVGVVVLHEQMPTSRWVGFAIVWVALIVLTTDMVLTSRRGRAAGRESMSRIANETAG
jgi:chloramphenicol-sensitive protein RarD